MGVTYILDEKVWKDDLKNWMLGTQRETMVKDLEDICIVM
jgi:hypothetical protein